jgi:ATP-binding cassette subfamily B protein
MATEAPSLATSARKSNVRGIMPLTRYLAPYKLAIAVAAIAVLFTSASVLGIGSALRYLIDEGLSKDNPALLDRAFLFLIGVTLVLAAASYMRYYLVSWIGERVVADIRHDLFRHVLRQDIAFFETTRTGELLSRLTTDTTLLQTVLSSSISVAARNALMLVGGLTLLIITSFKLTGYVLLIVPMVVVPIIILGRKVRQLSRDTQERIADLSAQAEEQLGAIRTIQALAIAPHAQQRFSNTVESAQNTALSRIRLRAALTALVIALVFGAVVLVLWIGGRDVLAGRITPGELSSFVFYAVLVASSSGAITEIVNDLQRAAGAGERIQELLELAPTITAPENPVALPEPITGKIEFDGVTFHYPARPDTAALQQLSLSIAPGERIAIVGPSGAGKTTILQLLLRFYDPASGNIRVDGVDVRMTDPENLRRAIGLVPQDPVIFSANAWENIRLARPDATDEEVRAAADAAAAREFLEALPEGFESFLGEKGVRLSGGQKQRLAIARAFIRNPRILLLDEATSALDSENETRVQQALDRLMQGRTTLIVAHRLATVQHADRIVVMDEGRIQAIGTHRELLHSSPLYARLASLQFSQAA